MLRIPVIVLALFAASPCTASAADEWGDLTLRFVYDGQPPKPRKLTIDKDQHVCKEGELMDESLLVGEKDRGLANVVVWLSQAKEDAPAPIHETYEKSARAEVSLVAKGCRYEPHLTLVRSSQVLVLKNLDPIGHTFRVDLPNNAFVHTLPPGRDDKLTFTAGERIPAQVACPIHPWMNGWLFVHDSPYTAASNAAGKLNLEKLPAGRWTFRLWHERAGFLKRGSVGGKEVEWPRGEIELDIKPGPNAVGDVLIKPDLFNKN